MKLIRLVGIMLLLYVKQEHAEYISEVEAETVGTGIMGRMVSFPAGTCGMWRALVPKVFFFFFLLPYLQHMEVPRPGGVKSELQLWPISQSRQHWI